MGNSVEKPFTCEICLEPMLLPSKKFKNKDRCDHPYCSDCMIKFIQLKISENVAKIKCPALDCDALLDPLYCRPIMTQQLFDKWCDLIFEDKILGLEHCYCPNTNCSALIVNECGGIVKKSQCPNCKGVFCFECKLRWHEGFECKFRDRNDIAFGVLVERENWKRCPQCHHFVERSGDVIQVFATSVEERYTGMFVIVEGVVQAGLRGYYFFKLLFLILL
ncbi:unnamed protein product [Ilex paraguariensis]|uniref:RBR-type E3 ubiquitin transferase n=1 Tax=Ilex paraguariensis TaxID=185542 RepID=A0ABC8RBJ6_9AQUA